jgi:hypothetical protein
LAQARNSVAPASSLQLRPTRCGASRECPKERAIGIARPLSWALALDDCPCPRVRGGHAVTRCLGSRLRTANPLRIPLLALCTRTIQFQFTPLTPKPPRAAGCLQPPCPVSPTLPDLNTSGGALWTAAYANPDSLAVATFISCRCLHHRKLNACWHLRVCRLVAHNYALIGNTGALRASRVPVVATSLLAPFILSGSS